LHRKLTNTAGAHDEFITDHVGSGYRVQPEIVAAYGQDGVAVRGGWADW
jgi:hypothetical protein